jgi:hypothetical protein
MAKMRRKHMRERKWCLWNITINYKQLPIMLNPYTTFKSSPDPPLLAVFWPKMTVLLEARSVPTPDTLDSRIQGFMGRLKGRVRYL